MKFHRRERYMLGLKVSHSPYEGKVFSINFTSLQTLSRVLITSGAKEGSARPSIMVCGNT